MDNPSVTRLNKYISEKGICSRREADKLIESGRVFVNGTKAKIGSQVKPGDKVMVNGQKLDQVEEKPFIMIALNKPAGIVCTTETTTRDNIVDFVNHSERIFPIGRLDKDSQGLILLTNYGDIVNKILRAGNKHEKEYIVTVDKPITDDFIQGLANGVPIMGEVTKKCKVTQDSGMVLRIVLVQGKNRQIRRMCEHFGYLVTKLERIRVMNISLKGLPLGDWRELDEDEINLILKSVEKSSSEDKSSRAGKRPYRESADGEVRKPASARFGKEGKTDSRRKSDRKRKSDTSETSDFGKRTGFRKKDFSKPKFETKSKPGRSRTISSDDTSPSERKSETGRKEFTRGGAGKPGKPMSDRKSFAKEGSEGEWKPDNRRKKESEEASGGWQKPVRGRKPFTDDQQSETGKKTGHGSKSFNEYRSEGRKRSDDDKKPFARKESGTSRKSESGRKPYGEEKSFGEGRSDRDRSPKSGGKTGGKSYGKGRSGTKPSSGSFKGRSGGKSSPKGSSRK